MRLFHRRSLSLNIAAQKEISSRGVPAVCFNKKYYSKGSKTPEFYEEIILKITNQLVN